MQHKTLYFLFVLVSLCACNSSKIRNSYSKTRVPSDLPELKTNQNWTKIALELPKESNEVTLEIWGEKTIKVDCNKHKLGGSFVQQKSKKNVYYRFSGNGNLLSTRMGCLYQKKTIETIQSSKETVVYTRKKSLYVLHDININIKYQIVKN